MVEDTLTSRFINRQQIFIPNSCFSGFSTVYLGEETGSKRLVAIKKIICHGMDDERVALREAEYHEVLQHKNILRCLDSSLTGHADPVLNSTSMVLLVLPYYPVRQHFLNSIL